MASPWIANGPPRLLGALVNLNHPSRNVQWHWFQMSVANLVVIGAIVVVFALAIVLPFPGRRRP